MDDYIIFLIYILSLLLYCCVGYFVSNKSNSIQLISSSSHRSFIIELYLSIENIYRYKPKVY